MTPRKAKAATRKRRVVSSGITEPAVHDPALCKAGRHPSSRKVGTVCMACGDRKAWAGRR